MKARNPTELVSNPKTLSGVIGTPKKIHVDTEANMRRKQLSEECCKTLSLLRINVDAKLDTEGEGAYRLVPIVRHCESPCDTFVLTCRRRKRPHLVWTA